jgi:diamine N-acetyltransferase
VTTGSQELPFVNITGQLVALGPLSLDLPYQRWYSDFSVTRTVGKSRPMTEEQAEAWYDKHSRVESETWFAVYERATWRPIGTTGLSDIDFQNRRAEFGVIIGEADCRGKGYGTESTRLMLDYAFTALGLHNVLLTVNEYNRVAIRAYLSAGFREIGRRRQCRIMGGKEWDVIYMDCIASEFDSPVLKHIFSPDTGNIEKVDL